MGADTFSIISSIVSIILGVFAIWLSIAFYRWSNETSVTIKESADKIASSVTRLEALFDRLYSDTFSMMRDTVTDMRRHVWPESTPPQDIDAEADARAGQKIAELRAVVEAQIAEVTSGQKRTDSQLQQVRGDLQAIVRKAMDESRQIQVKAREETLRERILAAYWEAATTRQVVTAGLLHKILADAGISARDLYAELFAMAEDGLASWDTPNRISFNTPITISTAGHRLTKTEGRTDQ